MQFRDHEAAEISKHVREEWAWLRLQAGAAGADAITDMAEQPGNEQKKGWDLCYKIMSWLKTGVKGNQEPMSQGSMATTCTEKQKEVDGDRETTRKT